MCSLSLFCPDDWWVMAGEWWVMKDGDDWSNLWLKKCPCPNLWLMNCPNLWQKKEKRCSITKCPNLPPRGSQNSGQFHVFISASRRKENFCEENIFYEKEKKDFLREILLSRNHVFFFLSRRLGGQHKRTVCLSSCVLGSKHLVKASVCEEEAKLLWGK